MLGSRLVLVLAAAVGICAGQPDPAKQAREVVELLLKGDCPDLIARFSEEMRKALSEPGLRKAIQSLERFGTVEQIQEPGVQATAEQVVVIVPVQFSKGAVNMQVTLNATGEVTGLLFRPGRPPWAGVPWQTPPAGQGVTAA